MTPRPLEEKLALYRDVLRVPEYFQFDPTEDYLRPPLQGHRLERGEYVPIAAQGELLLYRRQSEGKAVVIALNLGAEPISLTSNSADLNGEILLSTSLDREGEKITGALDLRGNEGVIVGAHAG